MFVPLAVAVTAALCALPEEPEVLPPGRTGPQEPSALDASRPQGILLASRSWAIRFASPERGLGLVSMEHRAGAGPAEVLVSSPPEEALLWRISFRGPGARPGELSGEVTVDNLAPCERSAESDAAGGAVTLRWKGIDLGDEKGVLDVTATVRVEPGSDAAIWGLECVSRSQRRGPWEVHYPVLHRLGEKGAIDLGIPRGNWGVLQRGASAAASGTYPSNDWPMQFLLVGRGDRGLAMVCRDPGARPKRFHVEPGGELRLIHVPEDMGKPGVGFRLPFEVCLHAYRGSWWSGAKLYRSWALGAPWSRRGPIAGRKDFPDALRRTALWWLGGGAPEDSVPRMKAAAERFDVPMAIHWYNWHQIPFDVDYPEYFPTKPGFAEGARELVAAGMSVMPYINGRLWDTAGKGFPEARASACKQPAGGDVYIETYGSGAKLAPMCPATPFWREKVRGIVRRLGEECGVNGVYIDQIGSAAPVLCHDPAHGHPLGGGSHWVDGYREMLEPIREFAAARGMFITTENNAEPYMDTVDAFLIWLPRTDDEIPLITAVYSGRTVYFASPSRAGMELDAFCMLQGRDLVWGCQLGWMGFELLDPERKEHAAYLLDCARHRRVLQDFLLEGEIIGEISLASAPPPIEATWGGWSGTHPARLPSVATAVWRAADGRIALLAANLSGEDRAIDYALAASAWALPGDGPLHLTRVRPSGPEDLGEAARESRRADRLGPREILAIQVDGR